MRIDMGGDVPVLGLGSWRGEALVSRDLERRGEQQVTPSLFLIFVVLFKSFCTLCHKSVPSSTCAPLSLHPVPLSLS